jgi:hypothetical protein
MLPKEGIHIVTDAIAELLADLAYSVQPGDQGVPSVGWQRICNGESLLEYAHQSGEVGFVFISDGATKPSSLLAVENH